MDLSLFLGQFWGWLLVVSCAVFLVQGNARLQDVFKLANDKAFAVLSGYIALVLGLATVLLHNVWTADWQGVVTAIGWISLVKGVVRIGFPNAVSGMASVFKNNPAFTRAVLVVAIVIGGWLVWSTM